MAVERRVAPRLRLRRKLALTLPGDELLHAWSYDLSRGGLQLRCERKLPVGALLEVRLPIPDEERLLGGYHRVDVVGRVVHVVLESSSGHYRTGIEFVEFRADGAARFERYWELLLRQQLTR